MKRDKFLTRLFILILGGLLLCLTSVATAQAQNNGDEGQQRDTPDTKADQQAASLPSCKEAWIGLCNSSSQHSNICDKTAALERTRTAQGLEPRLKDLLSGKETGNNQDLQIKAICSDVIYISDPARKADLQSLIQLFEAGSPFHSANRVIQLYNNHDIDNIAAAIGTDLKDTQKISKIGDDLLLVGGLGNTDESKMHEVRRYAAILDLPRPQVSMNIWSFQISSNDLNQITDVDQIFRKELNIYNRRLTAAIQNGWDRLMQDVQTDPTTPYFDKNFHDYLSLRYVRDVSAREGICDTNQYCLGYSDAFIPARPSLTRILLFVIAAQNQKANDLAANLVDAMQKRDQDDPDCKDCLWPTFPNFKKELRKLVDAEHLPLVRAAIADFLFQYKWTKEYPHDFSPYDLTRASNTLDSLFGGVEDAFNRDVGRYLIEFEHGAQKTLRKSKNLDFFSGGIITISSLSGQTAKVTGNTQNAFDATPPFTLADFGKALTDAKTSVPNLPTTVLSKAVDPADLMAISAALNVTKPTTAKIGRSLDLTVTPRSLDAAAAAELNVVLDAKEDGDPKLIGPDNNAQDLNFNRVADHRVETTVRVDTIKLFEVSSFSAQLTKSKPPFIVPGLGEIPLFGPIFRFRRSPETVYHRSFAVITAFIVPTALDLGYGLRFEYDQARYRDQNKDKFISLSSSADLPGDVSEFHGQTVVCSRLESRVPDTTATPQNSLPPFCQRTFATRTFNDLPSHSESSTAVAKK